MKLYLIIALIDTLILLAYPFIFLFAKVRRFLDFKR